MPLQLSLFKASLPWWREEHHRRSEVTDTFPRDTDFSAGRATLLTHDGYLIEAIAQGGRRGKASTFEANVPFERVGLVSPPVAITDVISDVRRRARNTAEQVFLDGYGLFTEIASQDIRSWLAENHQTASELLESILQAEPDWMSSVELAALYRMECDAVNIALEIAGMDRHQAFEGYSAPSTPQHFDLNSRATVDEDSIVIDDLDWFPGWERAAS